MGRRGLTFANTGTGLAFRVDLADHPFAATIKQHIEAGRQHVSVGARPPIESRIETIRGHKVEVVSGAKLTEISLVDHGAVDGVYATLVDVSQRNADLFWDARSAGFMVDKAVSNAVTRLDRIADKVARLDLTAPAPPRRGPTLDAINRWQTEATDALQRAARARI